MCPRLIRPVGKSKVSKERKSFPEKMNSKAMSKSKQRDRRRRYAKSVKKRTVSSKSPQALDRKGRKSKVLLKKRWKA